MPASSRSAVSSALRLARWENGLIAAAGVLLGAWWARGRFVIANAAPLVAVMLAAMMLTAAANAWNDADDVEIDRVAHPMRPLPRGELSVNAARWIGWMAGVIGLVATGIARPWLGGLTGLVLITMRLYSAVLKRHGLAGNIAVGVLASLPFFYGAAAVGKPRAGLVLYALGIPLHVARELAKDLEDGSGDLNHRSTIPLRRGAGTARRAIILSLAIFVVILAPLASRRPLYALLMRPSLGFSFGAALRASHGGTGGARLFKIAMVCALVAAGAAPPLHPM
jgi:geranylgeranylglycerol-phosphate geranylgeranyltransferase